MSPRRRPVPIALLLFAVVVVAQPPPPVDRVEKDAYDRMARAWAELAGFAAEKGAKALAAEALSEAGGCGLPPGEYERLSARVAAAAEAAASPEVVNKERSVRHRVGMLFDDLTKRANDGPRAEVFLFEALRVHPGDRKRCAALQARAASAAAAKDWKTASRILRRAAEADAEGWKAGKYVAVEATVGKEDLLLVKAPSHPMEAYVSLPKDWSATAKTPWPVVVAFDGAGSVFQNRALEMKRAASRRPYVVVVPFTFSNANELEEHKYPSYPADVVKGLKGAETRLARIAWDFAGLDALMPELRRRFKLEERVYVTGYSGGGMATYAWLVRRPAEVAAACPVSANFGEAFVGDGPAPENGGPPVRLITGENDSAKERIFPQSDAATAFLKNRGFAAVERTHLPGRGHETFPDLCLDFFDAVRSRKPAVK
ncbi:MAG TPA: hypothetical protein VEI02_13125 [Planctomycetota bacterium]|nr:hypothetical protein [Planctomycetota bacterium]